MIQAGKVEMLSVVERSHPLSSFGSKLLPRDDECATGNLGDRDAALSLATCEQRLWARRDTGREPAVSHLRIEASKSDPRLGIEALHFPGWARLEEYQSGRPHL